MPMTTLSLVSQDNQNRIRENCIVLLSFSLLVILRLYDFTGGYQYADASLYNY
jgi:hypothetical protein